MMNIKELSLQVPYISIPAHDSSIQTVMCLSNNNILTYSQQEKQMKFWVIHKSSKEYALISTITFTFEITSLLELKNNKFLIGTQEKLIIFDIMTYQCITSIIEGVDWIESLIQLSDNRVVSGSTSIRFFDLSTYKFVGKLNEPKEFCYSLLQLKDKRLVGGLFDGLIKVWDVDLLKRLHVLKGHYFAINCLVELKNSNMASGSWDMIINIWEMKEYKCLKVLRGHNGNIISMIQLKDNRLVSSSSDKCIKIYDLEEYNIYSIDTGEYNVDSIDQTLDELILLGTSKGVLNIYNGFYQVQ